MTPWIKRSRRGLHGGKRFPDGFAGSLQSHDQHCHHRRRFDARGGGVGALELDVGPRAPELPSYLQHLRYFVFYGQILPREDTTAPSVTLTLDPLTSQYNPWSTAGRTGQVSSNFAWLVVPIEIEFSEPVAVSTSRTWSSRTARLSRSRDRAGPGRISVRGRRTSCPTKASAARFQFECRRELRPIQPGCPTRPRTRSRSPQGGCGQRGIANRMWSHVRDGVGPCHMGQQPFRPLEGKCQRQISS